MLWDPVGVWMVFWAESEGAMDWKAWIGRASKNSWATMKGVLSDSSMGLVTAGRLSGHGFFPEETKRMFSVQIIGRSAYLLVL